MSETISRTDHQKSWDFNFTPEETKRFIELYLSRGFHGWRPEDSQLVNRLLHQFSAAATQGLINTVVTPPEENPLREYGHPIGCSVLAPTKKIPSPEQIVKWQNRLQEVMEQLQAGEKPHENDRTLIRELLLLKLKSEDLVPAAAPKMQIREDLRRKIAVATHGCILGYL